MTEEVRCLLLAFVAAIGMATLGPATLAQPVNPSAGVAPTARWITVPRVLGHLTSNQLGLVINTADPYSVQVGDYYARARRLAPAQQLRLELPRRASLTVAEFSELDVRIKAYFGTDVQALALAWNEPYAVQCNSITGALALGYDAALCADTCGDSRRSPYYLSATTRPETDLGLRPSMLLAAGDFEHAKAMIDRGVASDHSLGLRGAPPVQAVFVNTTDRARNIRAPLFPPPGLVAQASLQVLWQGEVSSEPVDRVLLYLTGVPRVSALDRLHFVPGALADHLTSFGGQLDGHSGQMPALDWIVAGATASFGTVSEPCARLQKFPQPQVLLLNYVQGSTAIEAYWKSVAWPQQGLFIGEPLAAPFARH